MRAVRCVAVWLVVGLLLAAAPTWSAEGDIAFEMIKLKHLSAGEVAPVLGGGFQFIGRQADRVAEPGSAGGSLGSFLPEGVKLITAGSQRSHYLLVAGTNESVAELRGFLALLDHQAPMIPMTVSVYPAPPSEDSGWRKLEATTEGGTGLTVRVAYSDKEAAVLSFPSEAKPTRISLELANLAQEFVPFPVYKGFPQVLMSVVPRVNADGTVTASLAFAPFTAAERGGMERVVERARSASAYTLNVAIGKEFVCYLTWAEGGAITAVMQFDKPVEQAD